MQTRAHARGGGAHAQARRYWQVGVDLCQRAADMIEQAGARTDDAARRRLLAGTFHRETVDIFGAFPDVRERSAQWLIEDLDGIDSAAPPTDDDRWNVAS